MSLSYTVRFILFFFNATATPEIYTLSLHDALPIYDEQLHQGESRFGWPPSGLPALDHFAAAPRRSEEHTSELQSLTNLVCRLLLEKKKNTAMQNLNDPPQSDATVHEPTHLAKHISK